MATEAAHAHDVGKLPLDVILAILDELSRDISNTPHLRKLSALNKSFNALINPRLWRSFRITDSAIPGPRYTSVAVWRRSVQAMCKAVTRDTCRASYIRTLNVDLRGSDLRWSTSSSTIVRALRRVLLGVPNLKILRLKIAPKTPHAVIPRLVAMLNTTTFPFWLRELECVTSMEPAISRFVESQYRIDRYIVHPDRSFSWMDPWNRLWKQTLGGTSTAPLPALTHFEGPPTYVRSMMQCHRHLASVDVIGPLPTYDLEQVAATFRTHPRCEVAVLTLTLSLPSVAGPVTSPAFTEHLPQLISHGYNISCPTIRSLKLRRWEMWRFHPLGDINLSYLREFPSLEYLEWTWTALPDGATFPLSWILGFVRDCTEWCPTLQQITLSDNEKVVGLIQGANCAEPRSEFVDVLCLGGEAIVLEGERGGILQVSADMSFWTFRRSVVSLMPLH